MAAFCLPKDLTQKFLNALRDGTLDPAKLRDMNTADRRAAFASVVGEENAREVNVQFESKLLLRDQQRGLVTWAKKIGGITEPARRDIISTINRMDRVLQPEDEQTFLGDLAAKRLGVSVTADEAKQVFDLSQKADQLRQAITDAGGGDYRSGWTEETGTTYGRAVQALTDRIESLKPHGATLGNKLLQVFSLTREAETSILHWSAPFVQLVGMISTKEWWAGLGKQFQYFASEENYQDLIGYIQAHPDYELAKDGKLGLTQLGGKLTKEEEQLQSHLLLDSSQWLSDRTGMPNLIRGWQRSFVGVCNYVRFERYVNLVAAARATGRDVTVGSKLNSDIASIVNNFTGRGNLGERDSMAGIGPVINTVFYSPRKLVATMEMFNPYTYAKLDPFARNAAIRQLSGFLVATGSVMMLARFAGAQVTFDPRSADFGKINIGGEKLDMTGGNASYLRLLARLATGQEITANGKLLTAGDAGPTGFSRADVFTNFLVGRLAPNAGMLADALYGHDPAGQAFSIPKELGDRLTPIVIDSFIKYYENNPNDTAALLPSLSAFLGVSLESPLPPISESGRDAWGDKLPPFGTPASWRDDPVNKEAQQLGLVPHPAPGQIRGVKLDSQQLDDYVRLSGRLAHARLTDLVSSPSWDAIPAPARLKVMKSVIQRTREAAAASVMVQSQGGPNDILKQATAAKMAAAAPVAAQ